MSIWQGKQRLCGVIGSAVFGFLSGGIVEWLADGGKIKIQYFI